LDYIYNEGKRLEALSFKLMDLILLKKQEFKYLIRFLWWTKPDQDQMEERA
jgi:hypothetical protein